MFAGRSRARRLGVAALLGALPAALGACGLLIGLEDHQAFPGADAGDDVIETPDAPPDAPLDAIGDAPPDVEGPDGCAGTVCGNSCVDTTADKLNCGKCGVTCLDEFSCEAGVCGDHIEQISAGSNHGCALLHNGSIWCWGNNSSGQLGIPADMDKICGANVACHSTPIQVQGLPAKMRQVAAGPDGTCAIDARGVVWCWGANESFQLGRPTSQGAPSNLFDAKPLPVPGLASLEVVSVGVGFACALETGGAKIDCWGTNLAGTLGNGQQEGKPGGFSPSPVVALPAGLVDISTGLGSHACALDSAQHVWCWGANESAQLGHTSVIDMALCPMTKCNSTPAMIPGLIVTGGWIRSGGTDTCAEGPPGVVGCWGSNIYGQLGLTPDSLEHPAAVTQLMGDPVIAGTFRGSYATSCVINNKVIDCWGDDTYGELGRGMIVSSACAGGGRCDPAPSATKPTGGNVPVQLATGAFWTMALTSSNTIYAWGANLDGRIGHDPLSSNDLTSCGYQGTEPCNPTPQLVPQPGAAP